MKHYLAAFLWASISTTAMADEHRFSAGGTIGFTHIPSEDAELTGDRLSGASFGAVLRYDYDMSNGPFVGLHLDWSVETASTESYSILDNDAIFTASWKNEWSMSFLGRIGKDFGKVSPYIGGGLALSSMELSGSATFAGITPYASISIKRVFVGGKAVIGADIGLSDNVQLFLQGEYAKYGKRKFAFGEAVSETGKSSYNAKLGILILF